MMSGLYDRLAMYSRGDYYPMHMPGHKRNKALLSMINPYEIDITEIPGFDNLQEPQGILLELSNRISTLYKAEKSYPLINGSTGGILAGISAATNRGDSVLVGRNCHKSVYHGIALKELTPIYLYPEFSTEASINGGISPQKIEEMLITHNNIKAVIITSPTYEGIVSDIKSISKLVHSHGAVLIVDEAHGAHFGFDPRFPESAVTLGADIVIHSLHKTLPSFTQTAVIHCNNHKLCRRLEKYLATYQTSSPSYVMMAGIDKCIGLLEDKGKDLFDDYYCRLEEFHQAVNQLNNLKIITNEIVGSNNILKLDPSKITVLTKGVLFKGQPLNGHQLGEILLDKYHIIVEMVARDYLLGMTSIADTKEGLERFANGLIKLDKELTTDLISDRNKSINIIKTFQPYQVMTPYNAMELETEMVDLQSCQGRISADIITLYPPGIPLIVPGERIDQEFIDYIECSIKEGLTVTGLLGNNRLIEVINLQNIDY
ncbi:MAG TPA: aminotransferase class I/II-fold pyridoxal phosphate-dependent enzyme [Clostridiales bacterium]|nr:aminotransferase class I/II-fold pyridoxal phosphate-dependent enzyme [Clostridiales bacterium]